MIAGTPEDRPPPDLTVLHQARLVAEIWRCPEGGHLRRAGVRDVDSVCQVAFAEILSYDASRTEMLALVCGKCDTEVSFRMALEIEGLRVVDGPVTPDGRMRRF